MKLEKRRVDDAARSRNSRFGGFGSDALSSLRFLVRDLHLHRRSDVRRERCAQNPGEAKTPAGRRVRQLEFRQLATDRRQRRQRRRKSEFLRRRPRSTFAATSEQEQRAFSNLGGKF